MKKKPRWTTHYLARHHVERHQTNGHAREDVWLKALDGDEWQEWTADVL